MITNYEYTTVELDVALERILREREAVQRGATGHVRSLRMAHLFDIEARLWSVLFESTGIRLYWRAALAAEASARGSAQQWRRRAAAERRGTAPAIPRVSHGQSDTCEGSDPAGSCPRWIATRLCRTAV